MSVSTHFSILGEFRRREEHTKLSNMTLGDLDKVVQNLMDELECMAARYAVMQAVAAETLRRNPNMSADDCNDLADSLTSITDER